MKSTRRPIAFACLVLLTCALSAFASAQVPVNGTSPSVATPTYNVDEPGRIPYRARVNIDVGGTVVFALFDPVPAGHRLVIQQVSAVVGMTENVPADTKLQVVLSEEHILAFFAFAPSPFLGNDTSGYFGQSLQYYIDAGGKPQLNFRTHTASFTKLDATIVGYLLDCTVVPCAPIVGQTLGHPIALK